MASTLQPNIHHREVMSMYPYRDMDPIKKEKLEAAARFRRVQYFRRTIKVLVVTSVCFCLCRFVLPPDPSESLLNTLNCYISKRGMFLLCNAIFAFLAVDSGMVAAQPTPPPVQHEHALMNSSESEGKELVPYVGLEKEEARPVEGSIVSWELGNNLAVCVGDERDVATTSEMVPVPPSEENEFTLKLRGEGKRNWNDGPSVNFWSDPKIGLLANEQRATSWELVPVQPTMAEEVAEEEELDVMSNEDVNKKFSDYIAKIRRSWKEESMQLVVV